MYSRLFFNILLFSTFLIGENLKVLKFELKINVYRCYNLQEVKLVQNQSKRFQFEKLTLIIKFPLNNSLFSYW